jgi:hypothetical protein
MRRFSVIAALAVALPFVEGAAAETLTKFVFVTVDAVTLNQKSLVVKGVLLGERDPVERTVTFFLGSGSDYGQALSGCHRAALIAQERPGAYQFEMMPSGLTGYPQCTLVRVNP